MSVLVYVRAYVEEGLVTLYSMSKQNMLYTLILTAKTAKPSVVSKHRESDTCFPRINKVRHQKNESKPVWQVEGGGEGS